MKNKNIKKQPSAQALSDDDLEIVSGGYKYKGRPLGNSSRHYYSGLTNKDIKKLEDAGIIIEWVNDNDVTMYVTTLTTKGIVYLPASRKEIRSILGPESD